MITYHYNANGNLLKQSGMADTIYTYDAYNRLTAYQQGEQKESYTYDAEGVRRSKTTGTDSIYFVSDTRGELSQTLAETDGKGNVKAEYTRADSLTAQVRAGEVSYYLYDGHGDVRALLNEAGRITDKYCYNAYGELLEKEGDTENHYLYTGEYYDGTSNLYYLRARYMNPATGNFLTMDTYEGSIYDPDTLHKYMYANGNPVTYSDPSGNSPGIADMAMATAINSTLSTFLRLSLTGVLSGITNAAITSFLGGNEEEVQNAFYNGLLIGFGIGAVLYVTAAISVVAFARVAMLLTSVNVIYSLVLTVASVIEKKEKETLVYGSLTILSLISLASLYKINCNIEVSGDKGCATIKWDSSNPEEVNTAQVKNSAISSSEIKGTSYDINKLYKTQPYRDSAEVNGIMETIQTDGPNSIEPIKVLVYDGKAIVIDGHHRLAAFEKLGYDRIPIKYVHKNKVYKEYGLTVEDLLELIYKQ